MPYKDHEKQKEFQRKWIAKRRADHFKGKKCRHCGKPLTSKSGKLDHVTPQKNKGKYDQRIWSLGKEKRSKELKKTQTLCDKCHKKKTAKDIKKMHEQLEEIQKITLIPLDELISALTKKKKSVKK